MNVLSKIRNHLPEINTNLIVWINTHSTNLTAAAILFVKYHMNIVNEVKLDYFKLRPLLISTKLYFEIVPSPSPSAINHLRLMINVITCGHYGY